jgi:hypothetical protein
MRAMCYCHTRSKIHGLAHRTQNHLIGRGSARLSPYPRRLEVTTTGTCSVNGYIDVSGYVNLNSSPLCLKALSDQNHSLAHNKTVDGHR